MISFMLVIIFSYLIGGCGFASPDAGHESVLVVKPVFFGHGGVEDQPVTTGRTVVALTTSVVDVDMRPQQFVAHLDDFMSADGVPLDFDAVIRLQVTDSVKLIKLFGEEWYYKNVEAEFYNRVRQSVRKRGMNEMAISTEAVEQVDAEVSASISEYIISANLPIKLIQVTIGKANPPDSVKSQRIETASQQQRRLTETERKLAEDNRKAAELSRADADNAYRKSIGLSPAQFIQLENIRMQREVCVQIEAGCTFIVAGESLPLISIAKR